jgi:hypothetical protein
MGHFVGWRNEGLPNKSGSFGKKETFRTGKAACATTVNEVISIGSDGFPINQALTTPLIQDIQNQSICMQIKKAATPLISVTA